MLNILDLAVGGTLIYFESTLLGAIIGDIAGSIYEFNNHRSKQFEFFGPGTDFTDDTV